MHLFVLIKSTAMKPLLLLIAFISIMHVSCEKTVADTALDSLAGKWKMIAVKDNATNVSTTKPASIAGDVIILIIAHNASSGSLSGNTPTNEIFQNNFTVGQNGEIAIPALSMTKVAETIWGSLFVDYIRDAEEYNLEPGGRLNIRTTAKTLSFVKS